MRIRSEQLANDVRARAGKAASNAAAVFSGASIIVNVGRANGMVAKSRIEDNCEIALILRTIL
jgi:hypothetical protein